MKARDSKGRFIKSNLPEEDKPTSSAKPAKKKRTRKTKQVFHKHHITYPDGRYHPPLEWTVDVIPGEHLALTQVQRCTKGLTPGFKRSMAYLLAIMPDRPVK